MNVFRFIYTPIAVHFSIRSPPFQKTMFSQYNFVPTNCIFPIVVSCIVIPCSLVREYKRFGTKYCFTLGGATRLDGDILYMRLICLDQLKTPEYCDLQIIIYNLPKSVLYLNHSVYYKNYGTLYVK
jgi:hypothetical protein